MKLLPDKLIIKLKMHLIHLPDRTSELFLACLKCAHNAGSRNTGNRVHFVVSVVYPGDCVADWKLRLPAAAQHQERMAYASLGKEQHSML